MAVTLYRAGWVLPVTAPPIKDGAVLVGADGRIAAVGPQHALDAPAGAQVIELDEAALLPGLVNVHAHPELALFRGALEDLGFRDWILRLVGAKRAALGPADYAVAARWALVEALRTGITTLAATEMSAAAFDALREAGMRGIVYREVFGPDPRQCAESLRELQGAVEELRREESDRVRVGVSPHAPYTVSDELFAATARWALAEGLPVATHAAESAAEYDLVSGGGGDFAPGLRARGIATPRRGRSTIELLDRLGVLAARPLLIHCVRVDTADIERIRDSRCAVAHCPIANAKLGHGIAPLLALRDAGIAVGLGSDSMGSNNRLDLLEEARFAALLQRAGHCDATLLPANQLLRLCTLEGARALRLDERIGSLEPGKQADLCAVSLSGPHIHPVHEPTTALFHAARGSDVILTVVAGEILFRDGRFITLEVEHLRAQVERAAARLARSLRSGL
jgi:cytosine/adenosine deaminase-related metal-dependent hydrolase